VGGGKGGEKVFSKTIKSKRGSLWEGFFKRQGGGREKRKGKENQATTAEDEKDTVRKGKVYRKKERKEMGTRAYLVSHRGGKGPRNHRQKKNIREAMGSAKGGR